MQRTIYLDMDGVMAAFDELVKKWLGRPIGWHTTPDITDGEWTWLAQNHPRLFSELPLCKGALEFAILLRTQYEQQPANHPLAGVILPFETQQFKIEFLTAIPKSSTFKYAAQDKILWGRRNFPGWDVCIGPFSRDKVNLAQVGDILIDDRLDNLKAWFGKGGQAIYHPTSNGFEATTIALVDAVTSTLPGLWKDGKRVALDL